MPRRTNVPKKHRVESTQTGMTLPTALYFEIYRYCTDTEQSVAGFLSFLVAEGWERGWEQRMARLKAKKEED